MKLKKHIPNAITIGNLICGCLSIVSIFDGNLNQAAYLVGLALVFDFLDGFFARILKVSSDIGKDLDSLADMVTFGIVPGMMLYQILAMVTGSSNSQIVTPEQLSAIEPAALLNGEAGINNYLYTTYFSYINEGLIYSPWLKYFAFVIPLFSCIRLAKFNNDKRQTNSFIGLPTPANAIVICSIPLLISWNLPFSLVFIPWLLNPYLLIFLSLTLSLLLVSEIPLFALKFSSFHWASNRLRYVFLAFAVLLFVIIKIFALPLIILLYILLSIVNNIFFKAKV